MLQAVLNFVPDDVSFLEIGFADASNALDMGKIHREEP